MFKIKIAIYTKYLNLLFFGKYVIIVMLFKKIGFERFSFNFVGISSIERKEYGN